MNNEFKDGLVWDLRMVGGDILPNAQRSLRVTVGLGFGSLATVVVVAGGTEAVGLPVASSQPAAAMIPSTIPNPGTVTVNRSIMASAGTFNLPSLPLNK